MYGRAAVTNLSTKWAVKEEFLANVAAADCTSSTFAPAAGRGCVLSVTIALHRIYPEALVQSL